MRRQLVLVSLGFRRLFRLSVTPSTQRRASAFVSCRFHEPTWGSNPDVGIDVSRTTGCRRIRPYSRHQEADLIGLSDRPCQPDGCAASWPAIPRVPNARKLISRAQYPSLPKRKRSFFPLL